MRATYDFCSMFEQQQYDVDDLNREFAEFSALAPALNRFVDSYAKLYEQELQLKNLPELLSQQQLEDLLQTVKKLNQQLRSLNGQEPRIKRLSLTENSIFARNKQKELCDSLAVVSTAYTTVEDFIKQNKAHSVIYQSKKDASEMNLQETLITMEENLKLLNEQAAAMGITM